MGREEILSNIRAYRESKNAAILMVSHSMSDVAKLTNRLLVMNGSHLAMDGTPDHVFSRASELVEMGLDIPEVTRIFMRLQQLGISVPTVYSVEQAVTILKAIKEGKCHA